MVQNHTVILNASHLTETIRGVARQKIKITVESFNWKGICSSGEYPLASKGNSVIASCTNNFWSDFMLCSVGNSGQCNYGDSMWVALAIPDSNVSANLSVEFINDSSLFTSSAGIYSGFAVMAGAAIVLGML